MSKLTHTHTYENEGDKIVFCAENILSDFHLVVFFSGTLDF